MQDPTPEQIEAFRAAWHEADADGDTGNRVRRGLAAALSAHQLKSDDVRRVEAQRDTQKTNARRARRARDKWQRKCEMAADNASMWFGEAVEQRERADDLERSLADIRSTLEASNDAMVEAIKEERDALDDRLAKVDVELSEALARAERAESLAEVAKATAHTHLETLVSTVAKRDAAVKRAEAAGRELAAANDELSRLRGSLGEWDGGAARQQMQAWDRLASHPFFADCYKADGSLIDAMIAKLDEELIVTCEIVDEPDPVDDKARELAKAGGIDFDEQEPEGVEMLIGMARHVMGVDDE